MKKIKQIMSLLLIAFLSQSVFAEKKPNFIIFLVDDLGYNDTGIFKSKTIKTPNLDSMAEDGIYYTSAYVGAPFCGPSRAALMTGSYPIRIGEAKNLKYLHTEPHANEVMIPELLKEVGYTTALVGKWHLGHNDNNHPLDQGYDYFFGTLSHNGTTLVATKSRPVYMSEGRGEQVRITQEKMDQLTTIYTEKSIEFIKANKDKPFFLYLSHNMPHVSLGVSEKFKGKSGVDLYSDVVMELDWSMGEIRRTLKEEGLDENTFVVFLSDNGPWITPEWQKGGSCGNAFPLRSSKGKSWEGGHRVPMIMEFKGTIPAGQCSDEMIFSMDIMPTIAKLAGAKIPEGLDIDGVDIMPMATGEVKESPHDYFYYYGYTTLFAIRDKQYKLVFPRKAAPSHMGWWSKHIDEVKEIELYDLDNDISETKNVASEHPEVVERLMKQAEIAREELGDTHKMGTKIRTHDLDIPAEKRLDYSHNSKKTPSRKKKK